MVASFKESLSQPAVDHTIPPPQKWPTLSDDAKYGIAWDIALAACENSEADPAAVYFQALTYAAAFFGANTWIDIGDTKHPPRLFTLVIGSSAKARKGTSLDPVMRIAQACNESLNGRGLPPLKDTPGPLSSGEGLIYAVRDPSEENGKDDLPVDAGVLDKRLLVRSSEVSAALDAIARLGNILSSVLRCFWESGDQSPLTKNNATRCTGAHVNIIGHITIDEFKAKASSVEIANGFVNRWLFCCARRTKYVSRPKPMEQAVVDSLGRRLADAVVFAQELGRAVELDEQAVGLWDRAYRILTQDVSGVLGAATSRGEAYVLRLALIFALLDQSDVITVDHLTAAIEVWNYSFASAEYIFGHAGDNESRMVLELLSKGPLKWSELQRQLAGKVSPEKLKEVMHQLQASNKVSVKDDDRTGRGRRADVYELTQSP